MTNTTIGNFSLTCNDKDCTSIQFITPFKKD